MSVSSSSSSAVVARSIRLCRNSITQYSDGTQSGYRLNIRVLEAVDMTAYIFVHRRYSFTPPQDEFDNVASPADIEEYPITEPDDESSSAFRLTTVSLVARDIDLLQESWLDVLQDINGLINSLNMMDVVDVEELEII